MSKKGLDSAKGPAVLDLDPTECPFREFRDNELQPEFWGMGPAAFKTAMYNSKAGIKPQVDQIWMDDQTQPLPRSVRQYLHGWIRAEELAHSRWEAETVVFEETNGGTMSVMDMQLSHAQVLLRSSFCRRVLAACFILERVESFVVEHQWENFVFNFGSEGWLARYHIYSPGTKPGGGQQHRPGLSKNGCYLVRLFYLGAWRCIWVNDQVPVDATDAPLLPFSPLVTNVPASNTKSMTTTKQAVTTVTSPVVHLWPMLLTKALLKLAAPDMNSDEDLYSVDDELIPEFNIMHSLTGSMNLTYIISDSEKLWKLIWREVTQFIWDDDDDTLASTVKSKSAKKTTTKEVSLKTSMVTVRIEDSKEHPPYYLPGITPAHEMSLLISMARDLPLKKPLPEPEVALWKHYRWIDWARRHGLYDAYACPRNKFLKVNGLLKLSYAPHLLDVMSTDSITATFREEQSKGVAPKKGVKDTSRSVTANLDMLAQMKEELREWVPYDAIQKLVVDISVLYYPSMYQLTSAASHPSIRITKAPPNKAIDVPALKNSPLYLQIDGPDTNVLRVSLNALHPRVHMNCGTPLLDYIEPSYLVLETFKWFGDCELPICKAFVQTRGYECAEVTFEPGRHICRIWVHSRLNWHAMLLSESSLLFGSRDIIQSAAVKDCPWASRFLSNLGMSFVNWIKVNRSNSNILTYDREFFRSYQPDLTWDQKVTGYDKSLIHWMFRKAVKSLLVKRLLPNDFYNVCTILRKYFCDPDFGLPEKPPLEKSLKEIAMADPCDCVMPEVEEAAIEEFSDELTNEEKLTDEERSHYATEYPVISHVCEHATEETPCAVLKEERNKLIKKHEAATVLQAHWRGTWARKCLKSPVAVTPDIMKIVMDNAFGNLESLSALVNELFAMYPSIKPAFSVASALTGTYGLRNYNGTTPLTPKCRWVPFFEGVFNAHDYVKVHFDVQSSMQYYTLSVYDNDTGMQMPQVYNAHITFNFSPNTLGYTVMGYGTLKQPTGTYGEASWQLTILSSINGSFHLCDNNPENCKELPLPQCQKLRLDEIFIPNRRNILGGIQVTVLKNEYVSFRAEATSPDLEIVVTLRTTQGGNIQEIATCSGFGEVYWPYISLESATLASSKNFTSSQSNLNVEAKEGHMSARSLKTPKMSKAAGAKSKSLTKLKTLPPNPKLYYIEVTAPQGWPLKLEQWQRVDTILNSNEFIKIESPQPKKTAKEKPTSAKDKDKDKENQQYSITQPQPDDAYVIIECSLAIGGGAVAKRDDDRDLELAAAIKSWDIREPGRNNRGAMIRKQFMEEYLEVPPVPPSESYHTIEELQEEMSEEGKSPNQLAQGPTPVSESVMLEIMPESKEEDKYLTMPEQLKDKFIPLFFVPLCTKEKDESMSVVVTPDISEAAKKNRHARIEAALDRMRELQLYNEVHVIGQQRNRSRLLDKLFVDSQWNPALTEVLIARDDAITLETLNRTLSANKKKMETKKK